MLSVVASGMLALALVGARGWIGCHNLSRASLKSLTSVARELSALPQIAGVRRPGMTAEAYVRESIRSPRAFRVAGFTDVAMPTLPMSDAELDALVAFLLDDKRTP